MGNYVDDNGNSLDAEGRLINTEDYFKSNGRITVDLQREDEYTRRLSQKIVKEYHSINRVFSSHLVAFVAFELWQKKYPRLDLFGLLRLPEEDQVLEYEEFREACLRVRKQIIKLKKEGKINMATHMKSDIDTVIRHGLDNVGIFHLKRPLLMNKEGNIITRDFNTLYYYHNRLVGYELEKFV
jgi:glycerol-3-phosphate O-acyltransferase